MRLASPLFAAALLLAGAPAKAEELTLFAAASMTDAMTELATAYAAAGNPPVKLVFASSSTLAKQIESGGPADLFISADQTWMDYLAERQLLVEQTRTDLAGNSLVLIAPAGSDLAAGGTLDLATFDWAPLLAADGRIAIGDPEHVPAGRYAKQALQHLGSWDSLQRNLVFAGDVRAALAFVETAEAVAGIVYATDAAISAKVTGVGTFPAASHSPVVYPIAVIAGHERPEVAAFYDFLLGQDGAAVLARFGFTVPARSS